MYISIFDQIKYRPAALCEGVVLPQNLCAGSLFVDLDYLGASNSIEFSLQNPLTWHDAKKLAKPTC